MIDFLQQLDQQLFFFFNSQHNELWDNFMYLISEKEVWFPFYAALIFGLIYKFRKKSWVMIVAALLAVGASDFTTSGIMKPTFERFRPSRDPAIMEQVHIVNEYRGGKYGFASSHAANSLAIATFFFLVWYRKYKWSFLFFVWAVAVSYSRIYLGVHYPGDILVGGLIGVFYGWLFYKAAERIVERYSLKQ